MSKHFDMDGLDQIVKFLGRVKDCQILVKDDDMALEDFLALEDFYMLGLVTKERHGECTHYKLSGRGERLQAIPYFDDDDMGRLFALAEKLQSS